MDNDTRLPNGVLRAIEDYAYALEMENRAAQRERYTLLRAAIREALDAATTAGRRAERDGVLAAIEARKGDDR